MTGYVHGYGRRENIRLADQAAALTDLLHRDTGYPPGSVVLEAGCGVGAQTVMLAARSPGSRFVSIDVSQPSLLEARSRVQAAGLTGARFCRADVYRLPFRPASFDHVLVCFLLEHLPRPVAALVALRELLRPGGTITVIEGDHGSALFHPDAEAAHAAIDCLVTLQARDGGDALIGRTLQPLLTRAGFTGVRVSPRIAYADGSRPDLVEAITRRTFTAMVEGVRSRAVDEGLISAERFDEGIEALRRAAEPGGTFAYTFFKAVAERPRIPDQSPNQSAHSSHG